jgi:hypothetical protein
MPAPSPSPHNDEKLFDVDVMTETWDMSNASYRAILEKQRAIEEERAKERAEKHKKRGVWRKIVDTLVPA